MPQFVSSFIIRLLSAASASGLTGRREARLPVSVSLADLRPAGSRGGQQSFTGFTCDLSSAGLSFVMPSVVIGSSHIFSEGGAALRVRLELPDGPVDVKARPVRYDSAGGGRDGRGYVVGARILEMSEGDRARYLNFLRAPARGGLREAGQAKASGAGSAVPHAGWARKA